MTDARYLVQMHGEPGSGKSTLARAIGSGLPAVVIDKDIISTAFIGGGQAKGSVGPGSYLALYGLARSVIEQGFSVVIDSPCYWAEIESNGRGIANATHSRYLMVETRCADPGEIDRRLATRERLESNPIARQGGPVPGSSEPTCERLVVDSARPLAEIACEAIAYIRGVRP